MPVSTSNLDYLIDGLRLHLYDIDSTSYRYADEWLLTSLVASVKTLMNWWDDKYLIDTDNNVLRNTDLTFEYDSPPIVEIQDERPIILMASIIIKRGTLENNAWDYGSWKDDEISVSNIEGSRAKQASLRDDWDELIGYITPPSKHLATTLKNSLIN